TSKKEQTKQKGEARGLRLFFMYRSERFQLFVDGHHGADLVPADEGGRPAARLRAGLEDGLVAPAQGAAVRDAEGVHPLSRHLGRGGVQRQGQIGGVVQVAVVVHVAAAQLDGAGGGAAGGRAQARQLVGKGGAQLGLVGGQ